MHKEDLIKFLQGIDGNPEIYIEERVTEFRFGLVNSATLKEIEFSEDPGGEPIGKGVVIVISES